MKQLAIFSFLSFFLLVGGCGVDTSTPPNSSQATSSVPTAQSPFIFVKSKTETDGLRNVMELYGLNGDFNLSQFRELCKTKKANATAKAFTYLVLFDDASNAEFPSSPFTAMYGIEEDKIKHIVAVFEYNKMNGFCEMRHYDPNMWEGKAQVDKL